MGIQLQDIEVGLSKAEVFGKIENQLQSRGIDINHIESGRPWGGFFVVKMNSITQFLRYFFGNLKLNDREASLSLSPKVLVVAPNKRLSWQYHKCRSEYWKVISGKVGVMKSDTNEPQPIVELTAGEKIHIRLGQRHRLLGLDTWGIVAEIWQHENPDCPSNEDDIIRISDDFGR